MRDRASCMRAWGAIRESNFVCPIVRLSGSRIVEVVTRALLMVPALDKPITRIGWTRDRYIAAYRAGLLPEPNELTAGDISEVPPLDPIHGAAIRALIQVLTKALFSKDTIMLLSKSGKTKNKTIAVIQNRNRF